MKIHLVVSIILIGLPLILVSCVSSLLKESPPTFSKDIKWNDPAAPFVKINMSVFPTWKNKNSGNVISIISDCSESASDQSLNSFHQLVEGSVDNIKLIKEEKLQFKNKSALVHFSQGEFDGMPIEIDSMSFKRKGCGYVTTLSGRKRNLEMDRKAYKQFNESLTFE